MSYSIRPLTSDDEPLLWELLYQAIHVPAGQAAPPRDIVRRPELARYVEGWGRAGDCGLLASEAVRGTPAGAVWLRLLVGDDRGYGYVADHTPELSMSVLPPYRGQGVGTQLLDSLFASACGAQPVSLSVARHNPALRLYERFGFELVHNSGQALTMKRGRSPTTATRFVLRTR